MEPLDHVRVVPVGNGWTLGLPSLSGGERGCLFGLCGLAAVAAVLAFLNVGRWGLVMSALPLALATLTQRADQLRVLTIDERGLRGPQAFVPAAAVRDVEVREDGLGRSAVVVGTADGPVEVVRFVHGPDGGADGDAVEAALTPLIATLVRQNAERAGRPADVPAALEQLG